MSANNKTVAIGYTLQWEGGYSNLAADPGGATNWGITIADAKKYWKPTATPADVKAMPKSVAIDIYRNKYWVTSYYNCDTLASGVDLAVFDFGVNSGPARAKRYLDQCVGGSAEDTINKLCDARLAFLKSLSTWSTFGLGWSRRVEGIRKQALTLAKQPSGATGTVTGAVVVGTGAVVASSHWPQHIWLIIGGCIVLGLIGVSIYEYIKNARASKPSN